MPGHARTTRRDTEAPMPQPERWEPKLADPGLRDLTPRDWIAVFQRAAKDTVADNMPMVSSAVAYSSFFAIPSILLLSVGLFALVASPDMIGDLMDRFGTFMPTEATELIRDSLTRLDEQPSTGVTITILGLVLALWASTSAMTTYMTAVDIAYDREDGRSFLRKRLVALLMVVAIGVAVVLVGVLLVFGPYVERFVGDLLGIEEPLSWIWWVAQWPVLFFGLLTAFAVLQYFGPDVEHRDWKFITPGSVVAVVGWLVASSAFAVYTSFFGSYNKAWGSFAAVIVTLTWLWLTALALLFGAEVNAEVERSRELRQGRPAEQGVLAQRRSEIE
jgi:membrane protein